MHHILLCWLLALALPLQGYAATHMLSCATVLDASAYEVPTAAAMPDCHRHAGMHGGSAHGKPIQMAKTAKTAGGHAAGHGDGKSSSCAACAVVTPMSPAALPLLGLDDPISTAIPFRTRSLPSVHPSLPERPPRAIVS